MGRNSYEREFVGQHLQKLRMVVGPELVGREGVPEANERLRLVACNN
jgi:hypothetical protein